MEIKKAVITAAAPTQRNLPLQTLVDSDGQPKTALQFILDEVYCAHVEEVCLVVVPGDQESLRKAAGAYGPRLRFIDQAHPRGYGHALHCAHEFVGSDPFLHLVGDHIYISRTSIECARQVVQAASVEACSLSAVQPVHEHLLPYYGIIGGRRLPDQKHLYAVEAVLEKPTPTEAEQTLMVPGLRAGHYLSLFGIHVLTPAVMGILSDLLEAPGGPPVQLSTALDQLARRERYLAFELEGDRYDIGIPYGTLITQLALALCGDDRDEILNRLVELLASRLRR